MKITNVEQVKDLLDYINKCTGGVKLVSKYGDVYNLKSRLSQYVAVGELVKAHGNELNIIFDDDLEEFNFCKQFVHKYPETV